MEFTQVRLCVFNLLFLIGFCFVNIPNFLLLYDFRLAFEDPRQLLFPVRGYKFVHRQLVLALDRKGLLSRLDKVKVDP